MKVARYGLAYVSLRERELHHYEKVSKRPKTNQSSKKKETTRK
jgi:hypothetical protein